MHCNCNILYTVTDGVPQGSIIGPLLFLLYVNDILNVISDISNPVLYADDTSLIIINSNSQMFEKNINTAIQQLNRWFSSYRLLLKLEKTYFMQFLTKNLGQQTYTYLMKIEEFPVYIAQNFWDCRSMITYHGIATLIK
jgi:hypothetical protein